MASAHSVWFIIYWPRLIFDSEKVTFVILLVVGSNFLSSWILRRYVVVRVLRFHVDCSVSQSRTNLNLVTYLQPKRDSNQFAKLRRRKNLPDTELHVGHILYKWIIRFLGIDSRFDYVNVFITVDENGDCLNTSELLYNNSYMNSSLVANNEIIR